MDTLSDQLEMLRAENVKLRLLVREKLPPLLASKVLADCTIEESNLLADDNNRIIAPSSNPNPNSSSFSSSLIASSGGIKASQLPMVQPALSALQSKSGRQMRILMEPDYRLMESLVVSQQNFILTDPSLPDNPIVYTSEGFCKLTGYRREQVVGRNCRFLQGEGLAFIPFQCSTKQNTKYHYLLLP